MRIKTKSVGRFFAAIGRVVRTLFKRKNVVVTPEIRMAREEACEICPYNVDGWCQLCDCLLCVKTLLASEQCPDTPPRWKRLDG